MGACIKPKNSIRKQVDTYHISGNTAYPHTPVVPAQFVYLIQQQQWVPALNLSTATEKTLIHTICSRGTQRIRTHLWSLPSLSTSSSSSSGSLQRALRTEVERGLDVVLDYLWGAPAERLLAAISGNALDRGAKPLRFVQIGSLAGDPVQLSSASLRSAPVTLLGSGLGSTSKKQLLDAVAGVFQAAAGEFFQPCDR